tara:strand:- start:3545 stop:3736 length:192 start_codon:yes stop_codon:yes gene_type:complete
MKKILYVAMITLFSVAFTSCASGEECVCDDGTTITENDAKDSGATLSESCAVAKLADSSCVVQ